MERSRERHSPGATLARADASPSCGPVLVPVTGGESERSLTVASGVATGVGAEVLALDRRTDEVERLVDPAALLDRADAGRGDSANGDASTDGEGSTGGAGADDGGTGGDPVRRVLRAIREAEAELAVLADGDDGGRLSRSVARQVARRATCDSLVVTDNEPTRSIASILVPVDGSPDADAALDAAAALARANDAWIELLRVHDPDDPAARTRARTLLEGYRSRVGGDVPVQTWLLDEADVGDSIVEQTAHYDVTVLGASTTDRLRELLFGSLSRSVARNGENTVVEAHRGRTSLFET